MAFLNPLLLFGTLGIAAPIIIHLLAKKQIKRVVWAAMRFLKVTVDKNQKRMTLEDLLLLIIRCAALILLALALARPAFRKGGVAGFGGSEAAILLLDNSASMSQSDGVASKWEQAQKAAEEVLDSLPSGSSVAVWFVSDTVQAAIPEPTRDIALARKTIRDTPRTDRGTDLHPALRQAFEVLKRATAPRKTVYLLTDGQANGWKQLSEARTLLTATKEEAQLKLVLLGEAETRNLAVTGLRMASALAPAGEAVRFEIEVQNAGAAEVANIPVSLAIDAEPPSDEATLDAIPAGESKKVSLYATFREPGFHTVSARVLADRAPADDVRTAAVRVIGEVNVLLVDGDPGVEPRESEVFYLRNALTPVPPELRAKYFIKVKTVSVTEFESAKLSDFEAVVLANVVDVSETALASLERFLRAGGGLVVFPGPKINTEFYNSQMHEARSFLPAAFGAPRGEVPTTEAPQPAKVWHLAARGYDHPIVSIWKDPAAGSLATAQFYRAFTLLPGKKSDIPGEIGPPALVLSYDDGSPAVMERTWGFGRVVQFSSSANARWNDLCVRPIYLPLVHRVLGSLLARQDENLNMRAGSRFTFAMNSESVGKDVVVRRPAGRQESPMSRRIDLKGGLPLLDFAETDFAGAYTASLGEDATPLVRFAAQSDPEESKLDALTAADLLLFEGVAQVVHWTPGVNLHGSLVKERTGTEFWIAFAVLALAVCVADTVLGNRWSRSR